MTTALAVAYGSYMTFQGGSAIGSLFAVVLVVDLARDAARASGLEPVSVPIRGGTDGSRLTELGVPTPNIFTGMQCIHGPLEWISVQDMATATEMCLTLAEMAAQRR